MTTTRCSSKVDLYWPRCWFPTCRKMNEFWPTKLNKSTLLSEHSWPNNIIVELVLYWKRWHIEAISTKIYRPHVLTGDTKNLHLWKFNFVTIYYTGWPWLATGLLLLELKPMGIKTNRFRNPWVPQSANITGPLVYFLLILYGITNSTKLYCTTSTDFIWHYLPLILFLLIQVEQ